MLAMITATATGSVAIEARHRCGVLKFRPDLRRSERHAGWQHRNRHQHNGGTISAFDANGAAINAGTPTVANAGQIMASATGGVGIFAGTVNVTANTGLIAGESNAISSTTGTVTVNNNTGGTIQSTSVNSIAIFAETSASVINAGTIKGGTAAERQSAPRHGDRRECIGGLISAGEFAISAVDVKLNNSGIVESTFGWAAVDALTADVNNSGTLRSVGDVAVQTLRCSDLEQLRHDHRCAERPVSTPAGRPTWSIPV